MKKITADPKDLLRTLLTVIHGNGSHYAGKHGLEKATNDAILKWHQLVRHRDYLAQLTSDTIVQQTYSIEFGAKMPHVDKKL